MIKITSTIFLTIIFPLILSITSNANASETFHACKQPCSSSPAQSRTIAEIKNPGEIFSIIDAKNLTAKTYRTELVYRWGEPFVKAIQIGTSYAATQKSIDIKQWQTAMKQVNLVLPTDLPHTSLDDNTDNAFRVILSPSVGNFIGQHITRNLDPLTTAGATVGAFLQIIGKLVDFNAIVTVRFSDGSTYDFTPTGMGSSGLIFSPVKKSGRTAEGVTIPEDPNDFIGVHQFSEMESVSGFASIANALGVAYTERTKSCGEAIVVTCSTINGNVKCTESSVTVCP